MKAAQLSSSGVAAAGAAGSVAFAAGAVLAAGGVCRRGFSMSSHFLRRGSLTMCAVIRANALANAGQGAG